MPSPADVLGLPARVAVGLVLIGGVGLLAHVPMGKSADDALLRLDLRTAIAHVEICREPDESEMAALPAHMRKSRECRTVRPAYRVEITIDGVSRHSSTIEPHGIRKNRPLIGEVEVPLAPGSHDLEVAFDPIVPSDLLGEDRSAFDGLPRFRFDDEILAEAGRVVLLTVDERERSLRRVER